MKDLLNRVHNCDCKELLRKLPDESVHCVVTSPPYWGLRDYLTATWEGGDPGCDHSCGGQVKDNKAPGAITTGVRPGCDASICRKCGAHRIDQQMGLEQTPELYLERMVELFREVRRVLRSDGTCWVNMGDGYASSGGLTKGGSDFGQWENGQILNDRCSENKRKTGLKPKDLIGMPWRLALALQQDGWWLRQDIIWHKPNPMPESVTDRCTKAHEYLFLLTKSPRYYFDQESIKEECKPESIDRIRKKWNGNQHRDFVGGYQNHLSKYYGSDKAKQNILSGRNKRSVWTIPTQPTPEAHFATFPEAIVEPCILAGTSMKGCCPKCGKAWARVVEKEKNFNAIRSDTGNPRFKAMVDVKGKSGSETSDGLYFKKRYNLESKTTGWQPSCTCDAGPPIPCVVYDPFMGSATTALVAHRLGRNWIGSELSAEYCEIAHRRIREAQQQLNMFHRNGA